MSTTNAPGDDTIALLDGQPLSRAMFDEVVRQQVGTPNPYDAPAAAAAAAAASAPMDADQRQRVLDELVEIELLARKARERGLDKSPEVQAEATLLKQTILSRAMIREQIATLEVSDAELAAAYEERVPPHQFRIAHIQLADEAAAQDILKQLKEGRPFAELARRHSQDTDNRNRGGLIGSMVFDQMPAEIATAVRHLKPGEHAAQPVKTTQGWHVVQLQALDPLKERPTLETARVWLHPQIVHAKVQAQQQQWRREAKVELAGTP
ncbi:MAG: peptidylprolyl isomerase [Rhizobacter sp.]